MNTRALRVVVGCVACLGLCLVGPGLASEKTPRKAALPKLEKLSWMSGTWHTQQGADDLVEIWSEPLGDSMMGVFRWVKSGKVWIYELVTISQDDDQVVFRLRHFDRKLVAWEEKNESLTYTMTTQGDREVIFENPERQAPRRFVYRLEGKDTLIVRVEGYSKGKLDVDEFRFQRQ